MHSTALKNLLRCVAAAGSFLLVGLSSHADEMIEGIAIATSIRGSIHIETADEQRLHLKLHDQLKLNATTIKTGKKAHLYFALSNGMGIGISENSEIIFETYLQRPFSPTRKRISHEPSVSILSIRITSGSIAIASNKLSPLSQARIYLPTGELRIHSATCIVQNNTLGAHITACEGTITYYYPDGKNREFIVEPQSIRISPQNAKLGKASKVSTRNTLPKALERFAKATEHASQRVFFEASYDGKLLSPTLIISPTYFNQSTERPYVFSN
jgi:hypothetical protein